MIHPNPLLRFALVALAFTLLAGCASSIDKRGDAKPQLTDLQRAEQMERRGEHDIAAPLFRKAAEAAQPPERQSLLLRAVDNLLLAGDLDQAEALLRGVDTRGWPELAFRQELLFAEHRLAANRVGEALATLDRLSTQGMPNELQVRYREDRATAYLMGGNRLKAANERVEMDLLLNDLGNSKRENQQRILTLLAELPDTTLELLQPQPPGILGGWMELARMAKRTAGDPRRLRLGMQRWREAFPNHPALDDLFADEGPQGIATQLAPTFTGMAVILPLSGHYRALGEAIRDGLLSAYYSDSVSARPQLRFLDSGDLKSIAPLYRQAATGGAQLVVGPLRKEGLNELAALPRRDTPILALNWLEEGQQADNIFQFGLAPEDEARQVAERAWGEGLETAIALAPQGEWGERVIQAFRERWRELGGELPESQFYDTAVNDFSEILQGILNLDESEARLKEMRATLGKRVHFEPRIRGDADFIFVAGSPKLVRQIRPQLQFHHASHLPVYSTSHAYSGRPDARADIDLEGVTFPDIPWLLLYEGQQDPLAREELDELFPSALDHPRLYAMGADVYEILRRAEQLIGGGVLEIDGRTGILRNNADNRILRRLVWARFEQGIPKVLGYSTPPSEPPRSLPPINPERERRPLRIGL